MSLPCVLDEMFWRPLFYGRKGGEEKPKISNKLLEDAARKNVWERNNGQGWSGGER